MPYDHYENWGRCMGAECNFMYSPRCKSDYCEKCCIKLHSEWLGHAMVGGKLNAVSEKARQALVAQGIPYVTLPFDEANTASTSNIARLPAVYAPLAPPKPRVPEPTELKELKDEPIIVPTPDNANFGTKGGKSGFPITYVK